MQGFTVANRAAVAITLLASLWGLDALAVINATIATGPSHVCYIEDDTVKCAGSNRRGQAPAVVDGLVRPRALVAGDAGTCALDDEGLKCWGYDRVGFWQPGGLTLVGRPKTLVGNDDTACLMDDDDVPKCFEVFYGGNSLNHPPWGTELLGMFRGKGAQAVFTARTGSPMYHCALLRDGKVDCGSWPGSYRPPAFPGPVTAFHGRGTFCALSGRIVRCWGEREFAGQRVDRDLQGLTDPRDVVVFNSLYNSSICVVDGEAVRCFGGNPDGQAPALVPGIRAARQVAGWRDHACAQLARGFRCWGKIPASMQASVYFRELDQLEENLRRLAPSLYRYKAAFLTATADALARTLAGQDPAEATTTRWFALAALKPFLEDVTTRHFTVLHAADLVRAADELTARTGLASPGAFPPSPALRALTLTMARSALESARGFLSDAAAIEGWNDLNAAVARATAQDDLTPLRDAYARRTDQLQAMLLQEDTRGLAAALLALGGYVER